MVKARPTLADCMKGHPKGYELIPSDEIKWIRLPKKQGKKKPLDTVSVHSVVRFTVGSVYTCYTHYEQLHRGRLGDLNFLFESPDSIPPEVHMWAKRQERDLFKSSFEFSYKFQIARMNKTLGDFHFNVEFLDSLGFLPMALQNLAERSPNAKVIRTATITCLTPKQLIEYKGLIRDCRGVAI